MDLVFYIKSELNYKVYSDNKIDFDFEYTGHSGITYYPDDYTALNFSTAITGDQFQSWLEGKMIIPHKQFGEFSSAFDYECAEFIIGYDDVSCSNILSKPNDFDKSYNKVFFYKEVSFPSISEPVPNFHILLSIFYEKKRHTNVCLF